MYRFLSVQQVLFTMVPRNSTIVLHGTAMHGIDRVHPLSPYRARVYGRVYGSTTTAMQAMSAPRRHPAVTCSVRGWGGGRSCPSAVGRRGPSIEELLPISSVSYNTIRLIAFYSMGLACRALKKRGKLHSR